MSITENSLFVRFFLSLWLCLKNAAANSALGRACDRLEGWFLRAGGEQRHLYLRLAGGPHPQGVAPQHRLPPVYRHHQHPLAPFSRPSTGRENGCGTPVCSAA